MGMTSGRFAAETIIRAKEIGQYNKKELSYYEDLIKKSFITKDLKKYKNASSTLEANPEYFNHYIPAVNQSVNEMLTVDGLSKSKKQKLIIKHMFGGKSILSTTKEILKMVKAVM